jgi:hypothetical protein
MSSGKQTSFQFGEVSPSLRFRTDAVSYSSGLSKLKNMYVRRAGGVSNRPGMELVAVAESQLDIPSEGEPAGIKAFTYWDSLKKQWTTVEYGKFFNPTNSQYETALKYVTDNNFVNELESIVSGDDGSLFIQNGETVDIPEGSVKQYEFINIEAGGTLRITGGEGLWTEIGCKGDCIINGTIIARTAYVQGEPTHPGGTFTKTSSFGLGQISYTISQQPGGNGGAGNEFGAAGGLQKNGNGGGGGGAGVFAGAGGDGESNGAKGVDSNFGGTANVTKGNGANSTSSLGANGGGGGGGGSGAGGGEFGSYSGGAGGGYRGAHGKGLVIYVEGILSGNGDINISGGDGYTGGFGVISSPSRGGGGGGGAGGSGGKLILKYRRGVAPSVNDFGGFGGAGGNSATSGSQGLKGEIISESLGGVNFLPGLIKPEPEEIKYTVLKDSLFITPSLVFNYQDGSPNRPFNFLIKDRALKEIRSFSVTPYPEPLFFEILPRFKPESVRVPCTYLVTAITKDGREIEAATLKGGSGGPFIPNADVYNELTVTFQNDPVDLKTLRFYRSSGGEEANSFFYKLVGQIFYTEGKVFKIFDYGAEDLTQTPPQDESAFTGFSIRNYGSAVYYQQRLIAAFNPKINEEGFESDILKAGDIVASKLGAPEELNFPVILSDTGAFQFSVPVTDGTPVVALLAMERLIAFTERGVYVIKGGDAIKSVLTPTNINPFLISEEGCSITVEPKMAGRRGYFINNNHTKLMAIEFGIDGNLSIREASIFSDHFLLQDVCQIEVLSGGEDTLYLLRRDGKLAQVTATDEGIFGFSLIETDGFIESIFRGKDKKSYISNISANALVDRYYDVLMCYVIRNGTRHIEKINIRDDRNPEGQLFLDCAVNFGYRLSQNSNMGYVKISSSGNSVYSKINIMPSESWEAGSVIKIRCSDAIWESFGWSTLHFFYGNNQVIRYHLNFNSKENVADENGLNYEYSGYFEAEVPEELRNVIDKDLSLGEKNKRLTRWLPAFKTLFGSDTEGYTKLFLLWNAINKNRLLNGGKYPVSVYADGQTISSPLNPYIQSIDLEMVVVDIAGFLLYYTIIDLEDYYSYGYIGIPYECEFETLDLETGGERTITDTKKLINAVGLGLMETRGGFAGIPEQTLENMTPIVTREDESFNNPTKNFNGHIVVHVPTEWNEPGRVAIKHVDPTPISILSVYPKGMAGD